MQRVLNLYTHTTKEEGKIYNIAALMRPQRSKQDCLQIEFNYIIYIHIHTHTYIYIYIYILHTYAYTYTYKHIHKNLCSGLCET